MERSGPENQMSGSGTRKITVERERSGERAESAAHNPLKPKLSSDNCCKLSYIRILQHFPIHVGIVYSLGLRYDMMFIN